jgi:ABC-type dipeptide/oligopeptide/nickel transport system ATPase component
MSASIHRSTKKFKVSMKPSTVSNISLEGEDELLYLIHQLDSLTTQPKGEQEENDRESEGEAEEVEECEEVSEIISSKLSTSKKKEIARTLIRNDRRISNQQKYDKHLEKLNKKQEKAELYHRRVAAECAGLTEITFLVTLESSDKLVLLDNQSSFSDLKDQCRVLFELPDQCHFDILFDSQPVLPTAFTAIPAGSSLLLQLYHPPPPPPPETRNSLMPPPAPHNFGPQLDLPMNNEAVTKELLSAIDRHPVVVLVGETGCGKSTQVPQIILDHAPPGERVSIVCTQPRRIAAISIAERVASERGQRCGDLVGYQVRLQANYGPETKILYCTTGILLKKLQDPHYLSTVSHIILDEVHERQVSLPRSLRSLLTCSSSRQVETDFLMALLRQEMTKRPALKAILMSATVQSQLVRAYFSPCALVQVPGRMFPVSEYYLEEVHALVRSGQLSQSGMVSAHAPLPLTPQQTITEQEGPEKRQQQQQRKVFHRLPEEQIAEFVIRLIQRENSRRDRRQAGEEESEAVVSEGGEAILVFLPGIQSIDKLHKILRSRQVLSALHATVYILHSSLSPSQQRRVFQATLPGEWKIVLATNIAESSVTIDDITHVIDSGVVREMRYDPIAQLSSLSTIACSRASLTQRKGRAGELLSTAPPSLPLVLTLFRTSEEWDLLASLPCRVDDQQAPGGVPCARDAACVAGGCLSPVPLPRAW